MCARSGVEQAPLQTYVSAALFAPSETFISDLGSKMTLVDYVKQSSSLDTLPFILEGHLAEVTATQVSPGGSKLALASYDSNVHLWDVSTGARLHTLMAILPLPRLCNSHQLAASWRRIHSLGNYHPVELSHSAGQC